MSLSTLLRNRHALVGAGVIVAASVPAGLAFAASRTDDTAVPAVAAESVGSSLATTSVELSVEDIEGLLFMRQEEKLAGDVYDALAEAWGLQVFSNIARAERTHESETAATLALYGIDDPVADLAPGEFLDTGLQELHDELVERGMTSEVEALLVGALIEEVDIDDLRARETDVEAIAATYRLLEAGSHNHLKAFVRNLDRRGVDYEAQVLEQDDVDDIVDGTNTLSQDVLGDHDHGSSGQGAGQAGGHGAGQGGGHGAGHGGGRRG